MKMQTSFNSLAKETNQTWFAGGLVALRLLLGVEFLLAGIDKMGGGWTAASYLSSATGPFASFFQSLAGSPIVDFLNIWGLTFIGVGLILGFMVRPASFFAALLMLLYYFAQFVQNTENGVIEWHLMYALIFVFFMSGGVGHIFGLDGLIMRNVRRKKKLIYNILFG